MRTWDSFVFSQANSGEETSSYSSWEAFKYHMLRLSCKPTINIDVVSHCNLNCASCYHFSPIATRSFLSPKDIARDLSQLSHVEGIDDFFEALGIMGGEPLLHPDLAEIILISRSYLPNTELRLWTNGILLEKASDELWDALSVTGTYLRITPYPIDLDYAKLADLSEERGVRAVVSGGLAHDEGGGAYFLDTPVDPSGTRDPVAAFIACPTGGCCLHLAKGRLYLCSKGALLGTLNSFFGTQIKHEKDDYLSIPDIRDVQELEQFRRTYSPMCRYCAHALSKKVAWKRSQREMGEWLVKDLRES